MSTTNCFVHSGDALAVAKAAKWAEFLTRNKFDFGLIDRIDMTAVCPQIYDPAGNRFAVDFVENRQNYQKKKSNLKSELLSRALGAGKYGLNVLDLSAGLAVDAVFLAQLGYQVTAVERNPLIFLALEEALVHKSELSLQFKFGEALDYLKSDEAAGSVGPELIYFDPMFPEKTKSALPRQEMVFFRNLVGRDEDALQILEHAMKKPGIKRVAVKRPVKAPALLKTATTIYGKLVRFDLYQGVNP